MESFGENQNNEQAHIILRIINISFQVFILVTLFYFSCQTLNYVKSRRGGQTDANTLLTFLFMGLMFLAYACYMVFYDATYLDSDLQQPWAIILLYFINMLIYLFQNLAIIFNLLRWDLIV